MVQVEVDDSRMCTPVGHHSVLNANMNVVQPAETGRKVFRAVMARWTNANEGS
jgi:hypothetical protein